MPPRPLRVPLDAAHGHSGRHAGAADATATRPGCGGPCGARPALTVTTAAAARARSTGGEATPGLARRQGARPLGQWQTFGSRLDGDRPCAPDGQQGQRPHREGDRPSPRPSRSALHTDPGPRRPWPPRSRSRRSSGSPPPAPPPAGASRVGHTPQRRSTPGGP